MGTFLLEEVLPLVGVVVVLKTLELRFRPRVPSLKTWDPKALDRLARDVMYSEAEELVERAFAEEEIR
ncbi:MAG TPA: hypothetical protein VGN26_04060 [Armatimonadota bacterium]|jgi:hypothetical protein